MTHYYSYSSLNYSGLTILVRWIVFYCIWNLWTLPRLQSSNEHIDVSIRAPGNNSTTILLQESLPVHMINGHKAVLISGLLEMSSSQASEDAGSISETTLPMRLNQPSHDDSFVPTRNGPSTLPKDPRKPRRLHKNRRISTRYQVPRSKEITVQEKSMHINQRKLRSKSGQVAQNLRTVPRQTSNLGESFTPFNEQPSQRTSTFLLLVFSGALVGGGILAVRALRRLEKWEIQSQEDSLAYDIAYTSRSETSYGSFELNSWQDDLSKFDV